jgi:UDP-N-acetylglucosamine 1-carboxyvinyltransferase
MLGAVLAKGKTVIRNAAREPEIIDLANFLIALGAKIEGQGTNEIIIEGVERLHGGTYRAIGDRIEAATYIIAGLMTKSQITVSGFVPEHLGAVFTTLEDMGAKIDRDENSVTVFPSELRGATVDTAPYPGFPTDVQAQLMSLMGVVSGPSVLTEHIFENRFMHVPELNRMGAHITLRGHVAMVEGQTYYTPAPVMCTDLRASAALVLAALVADGVTEIRRVYHLDRGYEHIETKLSALGAKIERVAEPM